MPFAASPEGRIPFRTGFRCAAFSLRFFGGRWEVRREVHCLNISMTHCCGVSPCPGCQVFAEASPVKPCLTDSIFFCVMTPPDTDLLHRWTGPLTCHPVDPLNDRLTIFYLLDGDVPVGAAISRLCRRGDVHFPRRLPEATGEALESMERASLPDDRHSEIFSGRCAAEQKRRRPGGISVRLPPLPKEPFVRNPEPSRERNPRGTCRGCTGSGRWRGMEGVCL